MHTSPRSPVVRGARALMGGIMERRVIAVRAAGDREQVTHTHKCIRVRVCTSSCGLTPTERRRCSSALELVFQPAVVLLEAFLGLPREPAWPQPPPSL